MQRETASSAGRVAARRRETVSVCVPVLDEEETVGAIAAELVRLRTEGLIDEVVVLDAGSADRTAVVAAERGATVVASNALLPELGPVRGKGDGLWRAQAVLKGDVVCFVDGDLRAFTGEYVVRLVAPLLRDPAIRFVKSRFARPVSDAEGNPLEGEGGRVTQLAAIPLLRLFYPELLRFAQPLSGQVAARRTALAELPISTGYAFDLGLLIDAYEAFGLEALAEVDIGTVFNRHRDLDDLGQMAYEVQLAVVERLVAAGRLERPDHLDEARGVITRPPFASLRQPAPSAR